jgi:hypothetical protein
VHDAGDPSLYERALTVDATAYHTDTFARSCASPLGSKSHPLPICCPRSLRGRRDQRCATSWSSLLRITPSILARPPCGSRPRPRRELCCAEPREPLGSDPASPRLVLAPSSTRGSACPALAGGLPTLLCCGRRAHHLYSGLNGCQGCRLGSATRSATRRHSPAPRLTKKWRCTIPRTSPRPSGIAERLRPLA